MPGISHIGIRSGIGIGRSSGSCWAQQIPTGLTAIVDSNTSITLNWTNIDTKGDGVSIERTTDGVTFVVVDTVILGISTYSNSGLTINTLYGYRVRSYKGIKYSSYSNVVWVITDRELVIDGAFNVALGNGWVDSNSPYDGNVSISGGKGNYLATYYGGLIQSVAKGGVNLIPLTNYKLRYTISNGGVAPTIALLDADGNAIAHTFGDYVVRTNGTYLDIINAHIAKPLGIWSKAVSGPWSIDNVSLKEKIDGWRVLRQVINFGQWGSMLIVNGVYYAYYVYGSPFKIGRATSLDGITWVEDTANNPVLRAVAGTWNRGGVYVPQVWKEGSIWYMLFGGFGLIEQIGLATSTDGVHWTEYASNPVYAHGISGQWDDNTHNKDVQGVIKVGSTYYMFITTDGAAREVGVASSTDLINWTPDVNNPIFSGACDYCPSIFKYGALYYLIITQRVGSDDVINLYSCANPTFHSGERTLIKTILTEVSTGLGSLDTPFVLTNNINRNSFPNDNILCYYSSADVNNINLAIMADFIDALT